jgi:ATP-dependent DNA helicase RecQ
MPGPQRDDWNSIRRFVLQRDARKCRECGIACTSAEADIHHLIPRSMGGPDDPSNLITLCDGCHAAHHPSLQASLSRRLIERWGIRLARWLDKRLANSQGVENLGPVLRLFGLSRFRDGQLDVILAALSGHSILMVSPTGSGKTICFQIPAVLKAGVAYVLSPLKVLMSEQVSSLQRKKLPGTFINGDLSREEKELRYELLQKGVLKFLYCTPERFDVRDKREVDRLVGIRPNFLVIDEAHCIDRWGRDFRPHYGQLGKLREALGSPPVLAFTASAGIEAQRRILQSLGIPDAQVFVRGVDRPNISFLRIPEGEPGRPAKIASLINAVHFGRTMIFVPTVKKGNLLREAMANLGHDVPFYHSQISSSWEREVLTKRFLGQTQPEIRTIICTNAFGMGLDVPDVRMVIHWQQPASVEDYLQEFGRAGRDRKPALAVLFVGPEDLGILEFMAKRTVEKAHLSKGDAAEALKAKLDAISDMQRMAKARSCLRKLLVGYFQESRLRRRLSIARRLIAWLFEKPEHIEAASLCCDSCAQIGAKDIRRFAEGVLGTPRPSRPLIAEKRRPAI